MNERVLNTHSKGERLKIPLLPKQSKNKRSGTTTVVTTQLPKNLTKLCQILSFRKFFKNKNNYIFVGGTPYSEVKTRDVTSRVMRGLRVPQTQYISDDLYQVHFRSPLSGTFQMIFIRYISDHLYQVNFR